jgi:hypothetical protein
VCLSLLCEFTGVFKQPEMSKYNRLTGCLLFLIV